MYGKNMEPVQSQVKSHKNNLKVAKGNGISAEMRNCDDDLAYSIKGLIEEEEQALRDMRDGKLQEYDNLGDAFKSLEI